MPAAHALAPHAAIRRDDQPLGRNIFERLADQIRHLIRPLNLQCVMVDNADHDLSVRDDLADRLEVAGAGGAGLKSNRVGIDLVECGECRLVALDIPEDPLL
jgi:ABC-type phosphonate transport system ATPase subunit